MVIISIFIIIASIIGCFWFPFQISISFLIIIAIFELYLFYTSFIIVKKMKFNNENDADLMFNQSEKEIYKLYYIYFNHPFAAITFAKILSLVQLSSFILVPLLLFKGSWIAGILIGLNYFIAGPIAVRLNPRFYLHDAVENGKEGYLTEKELIDSVFDKLKEIRKQKYNLP